MRTAKPDRGTAEALAIAALTFIAEEPERLGRFLALSGIGPESLRAAACESGFLLGVLDYLTNDESLLIAFSTDRDGHFASCRACEACQGRSAQRSSRSLIALWSRTRISRGPGRLCAAPEVLSLDPRAPPRGRRARRS